MFLDLTEEEKATHRSIKHFQHHHWPAWFLLVVRPTFLWSCMAQPSAAVWQNVLQNYPWLRHPHPTSTQHTRTMAALHHTVSTSAINWGVRYSAACCFAPGRWRNRMICHRLWGTRLSATVTQTRVFPWGVGGGRGLRCLRLLLLVVLYHSLCRRGLSRWRHCWKEKTYVVAQVFALCWSCIFKPSYLASYTADYWILHARFSCFLLFSLTMQNLFCYSRIKLFMCFF